jgi:putative transposase
VARFIAAQGVEHGIPHATACRALGVSPAWFYKWRDGDRSPRHVRRVQLTAAIRQIFAARHGKYGSPRITDDLREAGWRVSEKTVAAIMREQHLVARAKKRRKHTTRQGKGRWRAPDLVGRDFPAATVNQKWYGDGTEIVTDEGKLFLDAVLDMGSRRVVGFAMDEHHDAELAHAALAMAVCGPRRQARDRRGHHAHRQGSQYTSRTFRTACTRMGIKQSMGRVGSALDNAVIESWHSTLTFELRALERFATKAQARARVAAWIDEYNPDRKHSSIGMRSPIDYELTQRDGAQPHTEEEVAA